MSKKTSQKNVTPSVTVEQLVTEHDQELQLHPIGGAHNLQTKNTGTYGQSPRSGARRASRNILQANACRSSGVSRPLTCDLYLRKKEMSDINGSLRRKFHAWCFSRNLNPDKALLEAAVKANVPVFKTPLITMRFINLATLALEMMFAPRCNEIGGMVDILGVGVIIRGDSGIGKSEAVLALVERGYSLVADDITIVTRIDSHYIVGTSNEMTRNLMEIQGDRNHRRRSHVRS
jgi:hypothetical protein